MSYSIGALYETSDCWNANDKFIASSIDMALAANPGANLNGYPVEVNLLKVNTNVLRDFIFINYSIHTTSVEQLSVIRWA